MFEVTSFEFEDGPRACIRTPIEEPDFPEDLVNRMVEYVLLISSSFRQRVSAILDKGIIPTVEFFNTGEETIMVDTLEEPDLIGLAFMITLNDVMYAYFVPTGSPIRLN